MRAVRINLARRLHHEQVVPRHLLLFDPAAESLQFGCVGLYNTHRGPYMYRVEAEVAG